MQFCHCLSCTLYHKAYMLACILGSIPRLSLVQPILCGAHHAAVALDHMAWKPLLRQQIGMVHFFQRGPEICEGDVFYLCRRTSLSWNVSWYRDSENIWQWSMAGKIGCLGCVDFVFGLVCSLKHKPFWGKICGSL